jgi:hypothetical protein
MLHLLNNGMSYLLFLIILTTNGFDVQVVDTFETMDDCFVAREQIVQQIGRPIENYQSVCIINK